jgi:hypothetical protein
MGPLRLAHLQPVLLLIASNKAEDARLYCFNAEQIQKNSKLFVLSRLAIQLFKPRIRPKNDKKQPESSPTRIHSGFITGSPGETVTMT